ncbi:hypothetical protein N5079_06320 [Planotetraspora sp. A-T 1434]|uniref:hypothetical protein n=1 Tax=Planotetraspora sp. A-T 1434 TaxID=2979219 RepID=UPI0021BE0D13|nr:hypothetical protein [Planotetraspora sp. A-T 1434]MCT9929832.1 hypothetical protein [Planotetraspora sp. A-T 1434]
MFMNPLRFLPTGLAAGSLLAAMVLSASAPASAAVSTAGGSARAGVITALDYNSTGWSYLQVPWTTNVPDFQEPGFDDSAWPTGQAGFGTTNGTCSWNNPTNIKTPWAVNTDILARHWIHIPRDAQQVRIQGTVDNDAQVYLNGHLVQSVKSGNCDAGTIDVVVPAVYLDCCNLLAIRGRDRGVAAYLNVRVTYVKPTQA